MDKVEVVQYGLECPCCGDTVLVNSGCFVREVANWETFKRDKRDSIDALSKQLTKRGAEIAALKDEVIALRNQVAWCLEKGALKTTRDFGGDEELPVIVWGSRGVGVPILDKNTTAAVAYAMGGK